MTRTLCERLAAHDAPPAVGTLVRVVNERSGYYGMTGIVDSPDRYMPDIVCVKLTSTGRLKSFHVADLTPVAVERGE